MCQYYNDNNSDMLIIVTVYDENDITGTITKEETFPIPDIITDDTNDIVFHRFSLIWSPTQIIVYYDDVEVLNEACNCAHPYDTSSYTDPASADDSRRRRESIFVGDPDTFGRNAPPANGILRNLCVSSSFKPPHARDSPTVCRTKQNFIAELVTALKSWDENDNGDFGTNRYKNVRYAYFTFDDENVSPITSLNDDINRAPVSLDDLRDAYFEIEQKECGFDVIDDGDEPDLCSALDAAFTEFDTYNTNDVDPNRERKIAIISNNKDTECNDGRSICEVYRDRIYQDGIGVIMINIDLDETQDLYESCITYNDPDRIVDTTTTTLSNGQERNDIIEQTIKVKLCETRPSASPTSDPTVDPTSDPTTDPTRDPTSDPTIDPTRDPTKIYPTADPTSDPTKDPTRDPTADPTRDPTSDPTRDPTIDPTVDPTRDPTRDPTTDPTIDPTRDPTLLILQRTQHMIQPETQQ